MKVLNNQQNNTINQSFGLKAALSPQAIAKRGFYFKPVERVEGALPEVNRQIAHLAGDTVTLNYLGLKPESPNVMAEHAWEMTDGKNTTTVDISDNHTDGNIVLEIVAAAKKLIG